MAEDNGHLVAVRATVNLQGLRAGQRALVDPSDPYIVEALDGGLLVAAGEAAAGGTAREGDTPDADEADATGPD